MMLKVRVGTKVCAPEGRSLQYLIGREQLKRLCGKINFALAQKGAKDPRPPESKNKCRNIGRVKLIFAEEPAW
jgi:hypothetical protein